jgi:glycosyltransferase involved in cell wall biosynthesis
MKRVMILTNSLTGGGAERSMNLVSNELFKRGWKVALVPINEGPDDQIVPLCELIPLKRKWKSGLLKTIFSILKFNKVVRSWKPDVIVLNCELPELFGAALFSIQRLVVLQHTTEPWAGRLKFGRVIRQVLSYKKTTWIAVSAHLAIWPGGGAPQAILQNPIVEKNVTTNQKQHQKIERLVFIGRLSVEKRPGIVIEISSVTGLPILIIGDGIIMQSLKEQCHQYGTDVEYAGHIPDPWSRLKTGDLLIVPSAFEGDGLVVIEALLNGVPLLLADIPDFRRFEFPEINYCSSIEEYRAVIDEYGNELSKLLIPRGISRPIIEARSIDIVGDMWEKFLLS